MNASGSIHSDPRPTGVEYSELSDLNLGTIWSTARYVLRFHLAKCLFGRIPVMAEVTFDKPGCRGGGEKEGDSHITLPYALLADNQTMRKFKSRSA